MAPSIRVGSNQHLSHHSTIPSFHHSISFSLEFGVPKVKSYLLFVLCATPSHPVPSNQHRAPLLPSSHSSTIFLFYIFPPPPSSSRFKPGRMSLPLRVGGGCSYPHHILLVAGGGSIHPIIQSPNPPTIPSFHHSISLSLEFGVPKVKSYLLFVLCATPFHPVPSTQQPAPSTTPPIIPFFLFIPSFSSSFLRILQRIP